MEQKTTKRYEWCILAHYATLICKMREWNINYVKKQNPNSVEFTEINPFTLKAIMNYKTTYIKDLRKRDVKGQFLQYYKEHKALFRDEAISYWCFYNRLSKHWYSLYDAIHTHSKRKKVKTKTSDRRKVRDYISYSQYMRRRKRGESHNYIVHYLNNKN